MRAFFAVIKSAIALLATLGVGFTAVVGAPVPACAGSFGDSGAVIRIDWVRVPNEPSESDSAHSSRHTTSGRTTRVTIVEFEDFQCPYCASVEATIDQVREKYGDRVAFEYRDYPLPFHHYAMQAALAARCADAQGQFAQYRSSLYDNQSDLSRQALDDLAQKSGLNVREFDRCLDDDRYQRDVEADINEGKRSRIDGTPAFLINGRLYSGALSFEQFQKIIDADLASE